MMKNKDRYAVAVRKPDQEIEVDVQEYKSIVPWKAVSKIPFIRGIFSFVDSLVLGMKTLMYSASFFEDEEVDAKELTEEEAEKEEKKDASQTNRESGDNSLATKKAKLKTNTASSYFPIFLRRLPNSKYKDDGFNLNFLELPMARR